MRIRGPLRSFARGARFSLAAALFIALASCGREPVGLGANGGAVAIKVPLAFQQGGDDDPVIRATFELYASNPSAANPADRKRLIRTYTYTRTPGTNQWSPSGVVDDPNGDAAFTLEFPLIENTTYVMEGGAFGSGGTLLYDIGDVTFTDKQATGGKVTVTTSATYVGPGATAVRIAVTPTTARLKPGETATFTATAFDASNNAVTGGRIRWRSNSPNIAAFANENVGTITAGQQAGTATITAQMDETGVSGTASVTVELTPTSMVLVTGSGQTAQAGTQLPNSIRVRVMSNTAPVPGVTVTFTPRAGSGSVTATTAVTNATGEAETRWTLGSTAGTQNLDISASGVTTVSVSATATAPPRSIAILSVNPNSILTTGSATMVVEVRSSGNPFAGEVVTFASSAGGSFSPPTVTTGSNGQASSVFTSSTPGNYSVTASIAGGIATPATTITVSSATAVARLVKVSGDAQTASQGQPFPQPIVVRAENAAGQPLSGVVLEYQTQSGFGSLATGSSGTISVQYNAPFQSGNGQLIVRVQSNPSISVTFTYTVP